MAIKKGLLVGIIIAAVVLIVLAVGLGVVLSIHNATYDTDFVYVQPEDLIKDLAYKHTYYDARTKTVEVELNQDLINSLIKDNFDQLGIALPDGFSLSSLLFNTKDQRLYINAKYGSINIPISAKLNLGLQDDGITVTASDLNLGKKKAPALVTNQVNLSDFAFDFKYADFDLPDIFTVKDVQFGTGIIRAYIELKPEGIKSMAMEYRDDAQRQINEFKRGQSEYIDNFITKLLDQTKLLSDEKISEYVDFVLDRGELVNSAIFFALTDDLSGYMRPVEAVQSFVVDLVAPLSIIKIYDDIDETFEKIVYDRELRDLLAWVLPQSQIDEYIDFAEEYYGMYGDVMYLVDDLKDTFSTLTFSGDSIEDTVAQLQSKIFRNQRLLSLLSDYVPTDSFGEIADMIDEYLGLYGDVFAMIEDLQSTFSAIDFTGGSIEETIDQLQSQIFRNKKLMNLLADFIDTSMFTDIGDMIDEYYAMYEDILETISDTAAGVDLSGLEDAAVALEDLGEQAKELQDFVVEVVAQVDTLLIQDLMHYIENFGEFGRTFISSLPYDGYVVFRDGIDNLEAIKTDTINITRDFNLSFIYDNVKTIRDIASFADNVVTMVEDLELQEAVDTLMNKDFDEYQVTIPDLSEYGVEIIIE